MTRLIAAALAAAVLAAVWVALGWAADVRDRVMVGAEC